MQHAVLSYKELFTNLEEESIACNRKGWNFRYRATMPPAGMVQQIMEWTEWQSRDIFAPKGWRIIATGGSMVGEKITKDNTMFSSADGRVQ